MYTLSEFNGLPYPDRLDYLWENGMYLASRHEELPVEVRLYQLEGFFVEVCYYSSNEFELLLAFNTASQLLPYVEKIDLRFLFE